MAEVQVVYWRDIPAMVTARNGRHDRASASLSERFQAAIDEAAMRAGITGSDEYLAQWRRGDWELDDGDAATVAQRYAGALEEAYSPERLQGLVESRGQAAPHGGAARSAGAEQEKDEGVDG
jgi:hypothetical protein